MIASVFLMQPIGQALAQLINLAVLFGRDRAHNLRTMQCGLDTAHDFECRQAVDGMWRIVVGVGAIPALVAIAFRFMLPDSGLYNLEVKMKSRLAMEQAAKIYGMSFSYLDLGRTPDANTGRLDARNGQPRPVQFSRANMYQYFIEEGNWRYLVGTSMTWLILDVALYGFGLDNRAVLADMWAKIHAVDVNESLACWESSIPGGQSLVPTWAEKGLPNWQTDVTKPCNTIYDVLLDQTKHYLLTVSIGSILGCAAFIVGVNYIPRRQFLTWSFISLTVLFGATGAIYYRVHNTKHAMATAVMVGICHFVFNFGK